MAGLRRHILVRRSSASAAGRATLIMYISGSVRIIGKLEGRCRCRGGGGGGSCDGGGCKEGVNGLGEMKSFLRSRSRSRRGILLLGFCETAIVY